MIAYLDTSVFLRELLNQAGKFPGFKDVEKATCSLLLKTECLRTLDRMRLTAAIKEDEFVRIVKDCHQRFASLEFVRLTINILNRASASQPVALGTLDAIHLATAQVWSETRRTPLVFLTHDKQLARAATAAGFEVPEI